MIHHSPKCQDIDMRANLGSMQKRPLLRKRGTGIAEACLGTGVGRIENDCARDA